MTAACVIADQRADVVFCDALGACLDHEKLSGKGLRTRQLTAKGEPLRFLGVFYVLRGRTAGHMVKACPFCRESLVPPATVAALATMSGKAQ